MVDANDNVLVEANTLITPELADKIIKAGVEDVLIRTVLTCDTERGVCRKCYGINLATGQEVGM